MQEKAIEANLIDKLCELKYVHRKDITNRAKLEENFRKKFEELNKVKLTDNEFTRLLGKIITFDVYDAAESLRSSHTFMRDDNTPLQYTLVNKKDWCKNTFEVINQLRINTESSHHVYDIVLLLNGIPVAQIELKNLSVSPRKAMEQIVRYKSDRGNGYNNTLMCFLQLFIVSNGSDTLYFANNNDEHFSFDADERFLPVYRHADQKNEKIVDLHKFADDFLAKCTLGETISRYMVLVATERKMLMMRPYQIYAVKSILECIQKNSGNGYIWHTTGSGKTLTSFKASTLLKDNPDIEKCLFVVDRKDLDRQTRDEFNKFQEGCVEQNTNTKALVERLLSDDYKDKVIVTTIQKLGIALDEKRKNKRKNKDEPSYKEQLEPLKNKRMVFIFDECHRSQFGDNHKAIRDFFPKAQLFGFTGTPIFNKNSKMTIVKGEEAKYQTTEFLFEQSLHEYTIAHAIEDKNVLGFNVDYLKPEGKDKDKAKTSPAKKHIIDVILEKHNAVTNERKFNAIFATSSINDAIEYYNYFKEIQEEKSKEDAEYSPLNIACVFSPPANVSADVQQLQEDLPQEQHDNQTGSEKKEQALEEIIADYNQQYGTNHTINEFDLYYQDVQKRIKDQQWPNHDYPHAQKIDIIIVVDMLLTGFDSKFLNTLYVDKNREYHNLIQAFSRTNRVLNDTKPHGNILDFRNSQKTVQEAIKLFSGKEHENRASEIWIVDKAPVVIERLNDAKQKLDDFMISKGLGATPSNVINLKGNTAKAQFINLFKEVQRRKTQLDQYTSLSDTDKQKIENIIPKDELQKFKAVYLETAKDLRDIQDKNTDIPEEIRELDLEFVLFASDFIDYDYIMNLIADYTRTSEPEDREMSRKNLIAFMAADAKFMDDRADIEAYVNSLPVGAPLNEQEIKDGLEQFKAEKLERELREMAQKHEVDADALKAFTDEIIRRYIFDDGDFTTLLEPLGLGWKARTQKKLAIMEDLIPYLHKAANGKEISGLGVYDE